jgi:type IV fimbrial biogenesis protein FimT
MLRRAMKAKQSGFTLIELMFTILVLAVLSVVAAPNVRDFLRNSRLTSAANDLLADLYLARTEAIKRRTVVTVCTAGDPNDDAPTCRPPDAEDFSGWIVFIDDADPDNPNGAWDEGEEIIRRRDPVPEGVTAASNGGFVSYADTGFLRSSGVVPSATRVFFCDIRGNKKISGDLSATRAVTVEPTGRAGVQRNFAYIEDLLDDAGVSCP